MKAITTILLIFLLGACSSMHIEPEKKDLEWIDGKAYQKVENEKVLFNATLKKRTYKSLRFHIQIQNKSNSVVSVSPKDFYLSGSSIGFSQTFPVQPTQEIANNKTLIQQKRAQLEPTFAENLIDVVGFIDSFNDSKEEREERLVQESKEEDRKNKIRREIDDLENEIYDYENNFLKQIKLKAFQVAQGDIEFTIKPKEGKFNLDFSNGHEHLSMTYKAEIR